MNISITRWIYQKYLELPTEPDNHHDLLMCILLYCIQHHATNSLCVPKRPRQHERFVLVGLCWLYGRTCTCMVVNFLLLQRWPLTTATRRDLEADRAHRPCKGLKVWLLIGSARPAMPKQDKLVRVEQLLTGLGQSCKRPVQLARVGQEPRKYELDTLTI